MSIFTLLSSLACEKKKKRGCCYSNNYRKVSFFVVALEEPLDVQR
jgi:hypothetical protein